MQVQLDQKITAESATLIAKFGSAKSLLTRTELGTMLGLDPESTAFRRLVKRSDFPRPVYLSERTPRWTSGEVWHFVEKMKNASI